MRRILLRDPVASRWLALSDPVAVLTVESPAAVPALIADIERRVEGEGLVAAGFVGYEAAPGFDPALVTREPGALPAAAFGLYAQADESEPPAFGAAGPAADWDFDTSQADYVACVDRIRDEIAEGNTYQVNYTIRARARRPVDPWQLFLRIGADAPFGAYLDAGAFAIISGSPELFFRRDGDALECRPMKGTAPRGPDAASDAELRDRLERSVKNRAENVMITDMIRNDLGRVAVPGSVQPRALYRIEKYPTVWQATSTVTARTNAGLADLFGAMFPCASITGAPKVASMALIRELETSPRGAYCGAIGWIRPGRRAQFSVAIRTATVDLPKGTASYGVGGGIVWDSSAADEYDECRVKARVLARPPVPEGFELLETLLWRRDGGWQLLARHLDRLAASAGYFDFDYDEATVRLALDAALGESDADSRRVRLTLSRDGRASASAGPAASMQRPRVRVAALPVDPDDVTLYHKTTRRGVYEQAKAAVADCDDVLLWNTRGEATESTIANLLCRFGDEWLTPPVSCGLLPGTARAQLLADGQAIERAIRLEDLATADEIQLVNSVRGRYPVELLIQDTRDPLHKSSRQRARRGPRRRPTRR